MKIWRKDSTKPIKDASATKEEELTDISQASTPSTAQSKNKMEEIYSTKNKLVKYKRMTPLEAEEAAKRTKYAKEKLLSGKGEISLETPIVPDKLVELTAEYEEGTVIAEDIIEEVDDFSSTRTIHLQDIDEIDIDIEPATALKKYERQVLSSKRHDERAKPKVYSEFDQLFNKNKKAKHVKVVAKIPVYQHESKVNKIHLKAGKFTDVVESEYDEYLKSNDPIISKKPQQLINKDGAKQSLLFALSQLALHKDNAKNQKANNANNTVQKKKESTVKATTKTATKAEAKPEAKTEAKPTVKKKSKSKIVKFFSITKALIIKKKPSSKAVNEENTNKTIDYQKRQDAKHVAKEIGSNLRALTLKSGLFALFFVISIIFATLQKSPVFASPNGAFIYCALNLIILVLIGVVAKAFIKSGLKPLKGFRGNSDSAISFAYVICLLQQVMSLFYAKAFVAADMHLYTTIIAFGFLLNTIGRMLMVYRVRINFRFLTSKSPAYAAKIFNDEDTARKMLSGTTATRSVIAYQHKTEFLSDFLKISYAPDPSEEVVGRVAPITLVSSIFVGIVYGFIFKSFIGALCALAAMCCISIPVCILLAGNTPLLLLSKDALKNNAMVSGYPSVRQFCDSDAIMARAKDLYPKTSIKVNTIKYYADFGVEESLISAAAILKETKSPLRHIFDKLIEDSHYTLPKVESALYEDKLGLVGWINGNRILIGNRSLLDRYHIYIGDQDDELYIKEHKDVTYIASAGQLVAMIVTTYSPDEKIKAELKRAQSSGLCILVSTTDSNVTAEKIATDYELFFRNVKVLPTGYANICTGCCTQKEESSRAYLATRGRFTSLLRAVSNSVLLKSNLSMSIIIQIFGLLLGVLLCATMVLYATVSILNVYEMLLYMLFWGAATLIVHFIKRK